MAELERWESWRRASRTCCQLLRCLLFLALLEAVVAQYRNTIFQFDAIGRTIQVPDSNVDVDVLGTSNISCLGAMHDSRLITGNFGLGLNDDNGPEERLSGRCLYKNSVQLLEPRCMTVTSFSTMFHMAITCEDAPNVGVCQGVAFIITNDPTGLGEGGGYLGWLNSSTNGQRLGHNFAVELDFFRNPEFDDPDSVHVGININSLTSNYTREISVDMYDFSGSYTVWIEYDGVTQMLNVTVDLQKNYDDLVFKPTTPLISTKVDLTDVIQEEMYVGFSGSLTNLSRTSSLSTASGYFVGTWSFNSNGRTPDLLRDSSGMVVNLSAEEQARRRARIKLITSITVPAAGIFIFLAYVITLLQRRNARLNALAKKYHIEDFEFLRLDLGPRNFKYKELVSATKDFSADELVGIGGFGSVYRGKLRLRAAQNETVIAVKRISRTSSQGVREFLAEVKIISQVHHRNLVRLLGWCHKKDQLLLVYDYMPNGSLDQHLFKEKGNTSDEPMLLTWTRRLTIISGVAKALAYLHDHGEQRVIHRDVKSANVMLDNDFNARLGDFGLARLSDYDQEPQTTENFAGTRGYVPPEPEVTEKTDVYGFGVLALEVATGRRALLRTDDGNVLLLVDWVRGLYTDGKVAEAADCRLENAYDSGEMVTLLKIGLLCTHFEADERPTMGDILDIWKGTKSFPPLQLVSKPATPLLNLVNGTGGESYTYTHNILDMPSMGHTTVSGKSTSTDATNLYESFGVLSYEIQELDLRSRPWKKHTSLPM